MLSAKVRHAMSLAALTMVMASQVCEVRAADTSAPKPKMNTVTFQSGGEKMVGNLYLPPTYQAGTRLPAVLIAGPWLNVKEQVAANYA